MFPKVSIIIPIFNAKKYLERCIFSLINQTLKEIEIILINDGSTDGSDRICDKMQKIDKRITVIHKKNEGQGLARNDGIKLAVGEYIGFVDADDYVDIRMYEVLYTKASEKNADLSLSFIRTKNKIWPYTFKEGEYSGDNGVCQILYGIVGGLPNEKLDSSLGMSTCRNIYKKELIDKYKIHFFSERIINSEDMLFNIDFISKCHLIIVINESFYIYCDNENSFSKKATIDRFTTFINLYNEMSNRALTNKLLVGQEQRIERRFIANSRFSIMEISKNIKKLNNYELINEIKDILENKVLQDVIYKYPIMKLPKLQFIFFWFLKKKKVYALIFLSKIRQFLY